jgi:hypothetical protein
MYRIHEAQLQLPAPVQDRSVNVLTYLEPETQAPFQIVVNRDVLVGEETIPQCFDRQLALLTRQTKQFKIIRRQQQDRPGGLQPLCAVESSFSQGGQNFYQLQCMLRLAAAPQVLVFTLSSSTPLRQGHRQFWDAMLKDLDPAMPVR